MKSSPERPLALTIDPLSATIGAQIGGLDLTQPIGESVRLALYDALLKWKVIFFRQQPITPEQHLAFARNFGELEIHPFAVHHEKHPELLCIEHSEQRPGAENIWHSDVTWRQQPSLGSILHLRAAPDVGGDTMFADMGAAYRGLSSAIKEQVTSLTAVHDFSSFRNRMARSGVPESKLREFDRKYPHPEHPVIRTHPDTGEQSIYVNRAFTRRIVGVSESDSAELLETLYRQASYPEYQCRFRWQSHSIAFWDNRACQHYAVSDYWPQRRIAERVTIIGDKPFYRASATADDSLDAHFQGVLRRLATGEPNERDLQLGKRD